MKVKHILAIIILGVTGVILGALFKIQHWPGSHKILLIALGLESLGGILMIWKLISIKDFSNFLNK